MSIIWWKGCVWKGQVQPRGWGQWHRAPQCPGRREQMSLECSAPCTWGHGHTAFSARHGKAQQ